MWAEPATNVAVNHSAEAKSVDQPSDIQYGQRHNRPGGETDKKGDETRVTLSIKMRLGIGKICRSFVRS